MNAPAISPSSSSLIRREEARATGRRRPPQPKDRERERQGEPFKRLRTERRPHARALLRICGLAAVSALFERDPGRALRLFFEPGLKSELARCCAILAGAKKPYREVGAEELARIAGSPHHGGVVAVARPRPALVLEPEGLSSWGSSEKPILVLDRIGNAQNLGAIARSAAFFGVDRMIFADSPEQAMPSDTSYRVAEGGLEYLALYRASLPELLPALRLRYRLIGTACERGSPPRSSHGGKPAALILGNEEEGVDPKLLALCDEVVMIAGAGRIQSLNAAAAAAVLLYVLSRR